MPASARERAITLGRATWGPAWRPRAVAEAPGRIELLGNHVDYNGGLVLAGAIDRTLAIASGMGDRSGSIELVAGDVSPEIAALEVAGCRDWNRGDGPGGPAAYARGVVAALLARDLPVRDRIQIAIAGSVPIGFGMSSSAALCVSLVLVLSESRLAFGDIVAVAREAEHRCGSPVGAMDQSASVAGGVIQFEGAQNTFSTMSPDLGDYVFAVADSGVQRSLSESSYPERVAQSAEALARLQERLGSQLQSLGELSPNTWAEVSSGGDAGLTPVLHRRVEHVVGEVARVRSGVDAVNAGDWTTFGRLMTESGRSSNENYDISHPLVEALVAELLELDGVLGARMMGGGEGGPALALIHRDALPDIAAALNRGYFATHPSHLSGARLQVCAFGPGAYLSTPE